MISRIETLKAEVAELRKAKVELSRTEEELRETMRYKEAEIQRLLLQKRLSSQKYF
jgi:hypothetical protein